MWWPEISVYFVCLFLFLGFLLVVVRVCAQARREVDG